MKLGIGNGTRTEVVEGLKAGDKVDRCRAEPCAKRFGQSIENLRANKLRSFLTMFGILWGVIAVVVLTATGEGFQRGNQTVLEELGKNIAIVWGGRTTLQAGGERAGRADLPHPRRRAGHRAPSRRWWPSSAPRSTAAASR